MGGQKKHVHNLKMHASLIRSVARSLWADIPCQAAKVTMERSQCRRSQSLSAILLAFGIPFLV